MCDALYDDGKKTASAVLRADTWARFAPAACKVRRYARHYWIRSVTFTMAGLAGSATNRSWLE